MNNLIVDKQSKFVYKYGFDFPNHQAHKTNPMVQNYDEYYASKAMTPTQAGGPNQAENKGFSVSSTDGLVDKFTGDFSYNIPLMDVDGYPIAINYSSNVNMHTESSWVGLGWDLSIGAINREMRGIPDEANGEDQIVKRFHEREDATNGRKFGVYAGASFSNDFSPSVQFSFLGGNYKSSYLGKGTTLDFNIQGQFVLPIPLGENVRLPLLLGGSYGYSKDSKQGIGVNKSFMIGEANIPAYPSFGSSFHSRNGMYEKTRGITFPLITMTTTTPYGTTTMIPRIETSSTTTSFQFGLDLFGGVKNPVTKTTARVGLLAKTYKTTTTLENNGSEIIQPVLGFLHSGKIDMLSEIGVEPLMDFERTTDFQYSTEMKHLPFSIQTFDLFHVNALGIGGTFRAGRTDFGTYADPVTSNQVNVIDLENALPESMDDWPQVLKDAFLEIMDGPEEIDIALGVDVVGPSFDFSLSGEQGGQWGGTISNDWTKPINFVQAPTGSSLNAFDETTYFKAVGELTPNSKVAWDGFQGNIPIAMRVSPLSQSSQNEDIILQSTTYSSNAILSASTANSWNSGKKPITADVFIPKTVSEFPSNSTFNIYNPNGSLSYQTIPRSDNMRKSNHISSINVVSSDGSKYLFGIPVYNIVQEEVMFATGEKDNQDPALPKNAQGLTVYGPTDNNAGNERGRNHLYEKTSLPAFPHTFLLTEMLSSDYIDRSGNGPSIDDIGNYYKFNYTKGGVSDFKWRFPLSGGSDPAEFPCAIPNEGFLGTTLDDVASYSYGIKEVYYTHSVESKNLIALFYLSDRADGHAVLGENGVLNPSLTLKKLDKIVLYNLNDYKLNLSNAIPLQTVYFEYSYELCKHYDGNINNYGTGQSGKLTLKKIKFQSGNSKEMLAYSYDFGYSSINPDYRYFDADSWGSFDEDNNPDQPNSLYPYSDQEESASQGQIDYNADINSRAWKLISIKNPAGGILELEYEADRYGYVQDKRAARHFNVVGMMDIFHLLGEKTSDNFNPAFLSNTFISGTTKSSLEAYQMYKGQPNVSAKDFARRVFNNTLPYSNYGNFKEDFVPNNVLVFQLDEVLDPVAYDQESASAKVREDYFTDNSANPAGLMKEIFLKLHVNVKPGPEIVQEFIPAFLKIASDEDNIFSSECLYPDELKSIGILPPDPITGKYKFGYVVLEPSNNLKEESKIGKDYEEIMMHPFQHYALGYIRQNLPDKVYGSCASCDPDLSVDRKVVFGNEMNKVLIKADYVSNFIPSKSLVRLYEPDRVKMGGNGRVQRITYKDNWQASANEYEGDYKWDYSYGESRNKESGVAAFEPTQIMDENSHYYWDSYYNIKKKFPDERMFHPTPLSKALYPSPQVGYEFVMVYFQNSLENGHSLTNFHTYKDIKFKTRTDNTGIQKMADVISPQTGWAKAYYSDAYEKHGYSEGYLVETNDFHGKIASHTLYKASNTSLSPVIISKTTYHYKPLKSLTPMVDRKNNISDEFAGIEYDVHADSRFVLDQSFFSLVGLRLNMLYTPPAAFKFKLRPTIPKFQHYEKAFYSNCIVKHINYSAIVDKIVTEYLGSENTAQNLIYDKYTGNPVVSYLTDEYNDKLYDYSFPSHWYENSLREFPGNSAMAALGVFQNGTFTVSSGGDLTIGFSIGDRVLIGGNNYYVFDLNQATAKIMNLDGSMATASGGNSMVRVVSNRKNRLDETIQNIVSKKEFTVTGGKINFPTSEIISSSAINYKNKNGMRCGGENIAEPGKEPLPDNQVQVGQIINPFSLGLRGDLVLDGQFAWQAERLEYHNHGIRFDGVYADFEPFYRYDNASNEWLAVHQVFNNNYLKWRKMGDVKRFDEFGNVVEVSDQINLRSSVLYGYSPGTALLPVAQAINGLQKEIAFDGFEDYASMASNVFVTETHFDFRQVTQNYPGIATIVKFERHSGNYSLKVAAGQTASVEKDVAEECIRVVQNPPPTEPNEVTPCECTPPFEPIIGKEYLLSVWVKENIAGSNVKIEFKDATGTIIQTSNFPSSGPKIDGWQKIEGSFIVPLSATSVKVSLQNTSISAVYFDDFRIHPYLAGMTTIVYDDKTNLPLATHDGYNFTTFYNYDENLNLVRVRVETIEGIKTISESEFGMKKY